MKPVRVLYASLLAGSALMLGTLDASAAACGSAGNPGPCTSQGVTFSLTPLSATELQVEIAGIGGATGNWMGVTGLEAFSLIPGAGTFTTATVTNWTTVDGGISNGSGAQGCDGNGTGICFKKGSAQGNTPFPVTADMKFDVFFTGTSSDFSFSPTTYLKVCFTTLSTFAVNDNCTGDLLSEDITPSAVPAPIVGAGLPGLVAACVGLFGLARRRRRQQVVA